MASATARISTLAVTLGCLFAAGNSMAEERAPTKIGTATDKLGNRWIISSSGSLDRGTLPVRRGNMFYLEIDGRSYSFSSSTSRSTTSSSRTTKSEKPGNPSPQPFEKPAEVRDDAQFSFRFPEDLSFEWTRYVRLDLERGGVRFIDVMTNTGKQPHSMRIRCMNEMDVPNSDYFQGASTQRGEIISSENSALPPETTGVMLHFSQDFSPALPFFIIGNARDQWTGERRMDGYQLRLEYNGTLEPGKRAVFVHWIGGRPAKEKGKPEKAMERFISGGTLIDAGVPEEWQADVINFPKEAFKQPAAAAPASGVRLVMLDELCKRLGITRDGRDHLVLDRDSKIDGEFKATKVSVIRAAFAVPIPVEHVAAISGSAGKGRGQRVFLRDGSVLSGSVTLEGAKFSGTGVGDVALDVSQLDHLVLRTAAASDGEAGKTAGAARTAAGELLYVESLPSAPLPLRTSGGVMSVSWSEVNSIRERTTADPGFVVTLKDGSRLNCLPDFRDAVFKLTTGEEWLAAEGLSGYIASVSNAETLIAPDKEADEKPAGGWCETAPGALWSGRLAKGTLEIETATGVTKIQTEDVQSIRRATGQTNAPGGAVFDVALGSGPKLRGSFISPALRWQRGDRAMEIPWAHVIELKAEVKK